MDTADQYKELCANSRHHDNRLWIIPTTAYTLALVGLKYAFETSNRVACIAAALLVVLLFSGFLWQFVRYVAYGHASNLDIKKIETKAQLENVVHNYGLNKAPDGTKRWFIRLGARFSAATVMFYVMLLTWLGLISIAVYLAISGPIGSMSQQPTTP